jgi:hypothetical protein
LRNAGRCEPFYLVYLFNGNLHDAPLKFDSRNDSTLTKNFDENFLHYAILSDTWGNDDGEVIFKDLENETGKVKAGYVRLNHVTSPCCASLVSAVYSFTPARRYQLGVADSLAAHSQLKRLGNAVVGRLVYFEGLDSVAFSSC